MHGGDGVLDAQEHALGVDVHHGVPVVGGYVHVGVAHGDAGVVDQDVELAVLGLGELDGASPVVLAGDVEVDVFDVAAEFGDFGLDLSAVFVLNVSEDDLRALHGEEFGFDRALSARAAAYDGYLAVQSAHVFPPCGMSVSIILPAL